MLGIENANQTNVPPLAAWPQVVLKDKWRNLVKYLHAKDDRSRLPPELKARVRAVHEATDRGKSQAAAAQHAAAGQAYQLEQAQMMQAQVRARLRALPHLHATLLRLLAYICSARLLHGIFPISDATGAAACACCYASAALIIDIGTNPFLLPALPPGSRRSSRRR